MATDAALPLAACAPFAILLLCIAVMPLVAAHWWERHRSKLLVGGVLAAVSVAWTSSTLGAGALEHAALDYVSFVVLLGALFAISGGVFLDGDLRATPAVNLAFLVTGALLANLIGTTGASMVLIRPVLRTNRERKHVAHTVVFFIFLVSNVGGCLTPLGDPPLFLGYLRGVPFAWTLGLWPEWLFMTVSLAIVYWFVDRHFWRREAPRDLEHDARALAPLRLVGKRNLLLLALAVLSVVVIKAPLFEHPSLVRNVVLVLLTGLSLLISPREAHERNEFNWHPMIEVAVLFAALFATMVPAQYLLELRGAELGLTEPWQYFWSAGLLSGLLDNAPTYLAFGAVAAGAMNAAHPELGLDAAHLGELLTIDPAAPGGLAALGAQILVAISLGAVFMGANTYIGNGPNFMVKAVAERAGVRMPSFAGYMLWSTVVLLPLFVILTFLFLV